MKTIYDIENAKPTQAIQGDIVQTLNLNKFKQEYRDITCEVMKWHHDNTYTVLANGMPIVITGHEFINLNY